MQATGCLGFSLPSTCSASPGRKKRTTEGSVTDNSGPSEGAQLWSHNLLRKFAEVGFISAEVRPQGSCLSWGLPRSWLTHQCALLTRWRFYGRPHLGSQNSGWEGGLPRSLEALLGERCRPKPVALGVAINFLLEMISGRRVQRHTDTAARGLSAGDL